MEHYTRSERVQCPLMGCMPRSQQATARIQVRDSSAPTNKYDTTHHTTGQRPAQCFSLKRREHQAAMMLVSKWCNTT